jgi:hypothetical protein
MQDWQARRMSATGGTRRLTCEVISGPSRIAGGKDTMQRMWGANPTDYSGEHRRSVHGVQTGN